MITKIIFLVGKVLIRNAEKCWFSPNVESGEFGEIRLTTSDFTVRVGFWGFEPGRINNVCIRFNIRWQREETYHLIGTGMNPLIHLQVWAMALVIRRVLPMCKVKNFVDHLAKTGTLLDEESLDEYPTWKSKETIKYKGVVVPASWFPHICPKSCDLGKLVWRMDKRGNSYAD